MLHFLAAVALLIFIGEQIAHYIGIMRLRREQRRFMASLQPPPIATKASEWKAAALVVVIAALVLGVVILRMA